MNNPIRKPYHAPRSDSKKNLDEEESSERAFRAKSREISACELLPCSLTQNRRFQGEFTRPSSDAVLTRHKGKQHKQALPHPVSIVYPEEFFRGSQVR